MKKFNERDLSYYNGKNDNSVYVAYGGKVYYLSFGFLWKNGTHQVLHKSGVDPASYLKRAPHAADLLKRFLVVGIFCVSHVRDKEVNC